MILKIYKYIQINGKKKLIGHRKTYSVFFLTLKEQQEPLKPCTQHTTPKIHALVCPYTTKILVTPLVLKI